MGKPKNSIYGTHAKSSLCDINPKRLRMHYIARSCKTIMRPRHLIE